MIGTAITGTASYRQRIALPPDAVLQVRLEDVSRQDAPAELIAECTLPTQGRQVPLPFRLEYDDAEIDPSHRYHVRASLTSAGTLLFATESPHPVITAGAPTEVTLTLVPATIDRSLLNTYWRLLYVDGHAAVAGAAGHEPHIILQLQEQRLTGSTGCNRIIGTYALTAEQLQISPTGTTLVMCSEALMQQERAMIAALRATSAYRVAGHLLELYDGERSLARFEARYR